MTVDFGVLREQVESDGWGVTPVVMDHASVAEILLKLAPEWSRNEAAGRGGVRDLLGTHAAVQRLAATGPMRAAASAILGPAAGAVRALLFDKTPGANWKVIWHQDLTIAVAAQKPASGFGPWSVKDGVVHVQPPVAVLEAMVAVRLHLDPCGADNGPVRVLPGTHRLGRLREVEVEQWRERVPEVTCVADCGSLLAFRPLLLHASSAARQAGHRRVLHVDYGPPHLSEGLEWHTWVPGAPANDSA